MEKELEQLKKVYLKRDYDEPNIINIVLREHEDQFIIKKIDTITEVEKITVIPKSTLNQKYYTGLEFLNNATLVNKMGYYVTMPEFDKIIYQSYLLLYKDDYYELVYDYFDEKIKIIPSIYSLENFVTEKNPYIEKRAVK